MWISREVYQDLKDKVTKAEQRAEAEVVAGRALKETLNWLMVRVTSMEKERAVLLYRMFDIKIPVPELDAAPPPAEVLPNPFGANSKLNSLADLFADMGDAEAAKQGITHDAEGAVIYPDTK